MLKNFPIGSDLTLLNTLYKYPKKDIETGKYDKGNVSLIYYDNETNRKHVEIIEDPDYEFYKAKDDVHIDHNMLFIEEQDVEKVSCSYNQLEKKIAELTDNEKFYYDNIQNGNRYANKRLHSFPTIFSSDVDIQDHYRQRFSQLYTNNIRPISKAYFDIEADVINARGDFPLPGECPINAVNIIVDKVNKMYILLLRDENNPQIKEFEESINQGLFDEIKEMIRNQVGGWKQEKRFKLDELKFEFLFYDKDNEIQLIQDLFIIINSLQPDFVLAWNMAFDIPYIIARIKELGYNPADIICHPDFRIKLCDYYVDERNKNDFAERGDYANISSYSVFICQMIQFASRRKGQSAFDNFNLDYIGNVTTKVRKLEYSDVSPTLPKLCWLNYKRFVFYNIIDTIVQKCIEIKVGDIDYIFNKCLLNNTRYQKGHRQTIYLPNRARKEFAKDGFILGNNANKYKTPEAVTFPGAFVAHPRNLSDYAKIILNGFPVNIFNNCDDFDFTSLYPSMMREFNMAHNTQIGKIIIEQMIYQNENRFNDPNYSRSTEFIENFHSHIWLEFAKRYLQLAGYDDLYDDINYFFSNIRLPIESKSYDPYTGLKKIFTHTNGLKVISPFTHNCRSDKRSPFTKYKKPDFTDINNYYNQQQVGY